VGRPRLAKADSAALSRSVSWFDDNVFLLLGDEDAGAVYSLYLLALDKHRNTRYY
jgi:hypothetical protein